MTFGHASAPSLPASAASKNLFFRLLPATVRAGWINHLQLVHLEGGRPLLPVAGGVAYVHFPLGSVVSVSKTTHDGRGALLALIGREGLIGLSGLMGGPVLDSMPDVLLPGPAVRVDAALFAEAFHASWPVSNLVLRYLNASFTQVGQAAYCYRHHGPEEYLCTLLLRLQDRTGRHCIHMTQDQLARLAGLRRETISHAATRLQHSGALSYRRGQIEVEDRQTLEAHACDCYRLVEGAYQRGYFGNENPWAEPLPAG
jgi:CRP-like cAMP-binding protein